jgi:hypothetical protein
MNNQIVKGIGQGFKKLAEETVEKLGDESQKILETTISGKELLGLDGGISNNQLAHEQQEDEIKKQEEIRRIKNEMGLGRDVEKEVEEIRNQKEKEEEEKEKYFEQMKEQQEQEKQRQIEEQNMNVDLLTPKKHHKDKGGNKHKTQQPDQSQMSQTQEFKGKVN